MSARTTSTTRFSVTARISTPQAVAIHTVALNANQPSIASRKTKSILAAQYPATAKIKIAQPRLLRSSETKSEVL